MNKVYQKISGVGTGGRDLRVGSRVRLYAASDHLLILQSTGYTEHYKRIFFRDIRYVYIRQTKVQLYTGIVSAVLTLIPALLYFVSAPLTLVAFVCAPFLMWFLINLFRGPTCECYVSTNVQTLKLPVPRRLAKVRRIIEFLRGKTVDPSVEQSQPVA